MTNTITGHDINRIMSETKIESVTMGEKTTVVTATLPNGFVIVESSSCVDVSNYDQTIGEDICIGKIVDKVWELEGYRLQDHNYKHSQSGLKFQ
jgi:hypothetical protein